MKVLDTLGINPTKGELLTLASKSGQGKTSLLCKLACDLVLEDKNVLYITNETEIQVINRKCSPHLVDVKKGDLTIVSTDFPVETMNVYFENHYYDAVILDGYFGNKTNFRILAQKHDTLIVNTIQMNREGSINDARPMTVSDCVISITRTKQKQLSILDKLKNFFVFWKPKKLAPNSTLGIIKNRYGKHGSMDVNFNSENLSLNK